MTPPPGSEFTGPSPEGLPEEDQPGTAAVHLNDPEPKQASGGAAKKIALATGSVIVVGAIGAAAYLAYADPSVDSTPRRTSASAASTATPTAQAGPPATIVDSETTDPRALTAAEAFPSAKITLEGRTFRRVKVDTTDKCQTAAVGAFADALTKHQCHRVLRATYVDGKRDYAVTAGIAVLPTRQAAQAVNQAKNLPTNVWFRGLNGSRANSADRVTISGGYAADLVWGRYIVFSYATYADGHTPATNDTKLAAISDAFRDRLAQVIEQRITN